MSVVRFCTLNLVQKMWTCRIIQNLSESLTVLNPIDHKPFIECSSVVLSGMTFDLIWGKLLDLFFKFAHRKKFHEERRAHLTVSRLRGISVWHWHKVVSWLGQFARTMYPASINSRRNFFASDASLPWCKIPISMFFSMALPVRLADVTKIVFPSLISAFA